MRVMGPLALHYYFPDQIDLYAKLERLGERYFTDIDFAAYGKGRKHMVNFMKDMGYEADQQTMVISGTLGMGTATSTCLRKPASITSDATLGSS